MEKITELRLDTSPAAYISKTSIHKARYSKLFFVLDLTKKVFSLMYRTYDIFFFPLFP